MVEGKVQIEGQVIHVIVKHCHDLTKLLAYLTAEQQQDLPLLTLSRADERGPFPAENKRTQVRKNDQTEIFPKGRNFK